MSVFNKTIDFLKKIVTDSENAEEDEIVRKLFAHIDTKDFIYVPEKDNKIKLVHINEIYFVSKFKKDIIIRTFDEEINYLNPTCDIFLYLEGYEGKFRYMDSKVIGNIQNVVAYDSFFNKIYFSDDISIDATGTFIQKVIYPLLGSSADKYKKGVSPRKEYAKGFK